MGDKVVRVIGAGLAGSEATWQLVRFGIKVVLYEMRPEKTTPAHRTGLFGELVCSNSLRSKELTTGAGILKEELRLAGSLIMEAALRAEVPAGGALAVDREVFAQYITDTIQDHPLVEVHRKELTELPEGPTIVATGPLTSDALSDALKKVLAGEYLYFYDAIAPVVDAESINWSKVFRASRYGKGGDDYVNCPMTKQEYERFYEALIEADRISPHEFEHDRVFEGCMPIEIMARRGKDTLRFGPMKPVGLVDPRTGQQPYAVVQLRVENKEATAYNLVGFQTRLRWSEQKRVFRLIPGLENAEFLRYGSMHRNTFINGPMFLNKDLSVKGREDLYLAGQITGVEGYIESTAMGLVAGVNLARAVLKKEFVPVPEVTAHGALIRYITESSPEGFQPSNINFGLFPPIKGRFRNKKQKKQAIAARAIRAWEEYLRKVMPEGPS